MNKIKKFKQGIGGLLFILTASIGTLTLLTVARISTLNNVKSLANSSAYFVAYESAFNLYNNHADSGTYTTIPRILKNDLVPVNEFNYTLEQIYGQHLASGSGWCTVEWDRDNAIATVRFGAFETLNYGAVEPNEQKIIIEK